MTFSYIRIQPKSEVLFAYYLSHPGLAGLHQNLFFPLMYIAHEENHTMQNSHPTIIFINYDSILLPFKL